MARLYWPTLRTVLDRTRRYIQKHQAGLQISLTTDQYNCVVAVLNAILTCLSTLPRETPSP